MVFWLLVRLPRVSSDPSAYPRLASLWSLIHSQGSSRWRTWGYPPLLRKALDESNTARHSRASGQLQSATSSRCLRQVLVSKRSRRQLDTASTSI